MCFHFDQKILHKLHLNKRSLLYIFCGLSLLILALFYYRQSDAVRFRLLTEDIFRTAFESDTLSLHYFLKEPARYGIKSDEISLPLYETSVEKERLQTLHTQIAELESIRPENLPVQSQKDYNLLLDYMKSEEALSAYPYFDEPFSPGSGLQAQLPILLAEYRFRDVSDIDTYLELLRLLPAYFESLGQYEINKSAAGMFMSEHACRNVIEQLTTIPDVASVTNDTHFLCTSFAQKLTPLSDAGVLTEEMCQQYQETNREYLLNYFIPAYQSTTDTLLSLYGSNQTEGGLCTLPDGKAYYTLYLTHVTGTSKSIPEIRELLKEDFADICHEIRLVSAELDGSRVSDSFALSEPAEMMRVLMEQTQTDFPPYPDAGREKINCTLKKVTPGLETYVSPAFYMTPQLDDVTDNSIYINYGQSPSNLTLFTTLAHEGYPGHLYQSVYYYLSIGDQKRTPIRTLLHYGGYIEGYATYAENLSYEYAKEYGSPAYIRLSQLTRNMQLCLYSLMDISIHYDGMTLSEAQQVLSSVGITDTSVAKEIYEYIVSEPANYPKYYLSYLEILECKELAQKQWGDSYSDYEFHRFFLDYGPAGFVDIRQAIIDR